MTRSLTILASMLALAVGMAVGQTTQTTGTIFTSGQGVQAVNTNNSTSGTFAYAITGSPATIRITVSGCLYVTGGCDLLDTYTTTTNTTRTPSIVSTYNYFLIAATWTGGTAPSVVVTTTLTGGTGPVPVTGQPVMMFSSIGAPTTACTSSQLNTDKSSGDLYNCKNGVWNKVSAAASSVSLTATLPVVMAPSPTTGIGVASCPTCTITVGSGTITVTSDAPTTGACATEHTVSVSGLLTTDVVKVGFNGDPTGVTGIAPTASGGVYVVAYPKSAGTLGLKVCNDTAGTITVGTLVLNYQVVR